MIGVILTIAGLAIGLILAMAALDAMRKRALRYRRERDEAHADWSLAVKSYVRTKDERSASQKTVDKLGAELLRVKEDRDRLKKLSRDLQNLHKKMGDGLQKMYAELRLKESAPVLPANKIPNFVKFGPQPIPEARKK
jgi:hypothetical protein